jgi:hypothetical protein
MVELYMTMTTFTSTFFGRAAEVGNLLEILCRFVKPAPRLTLV